MRDQLRRIMRRFRQLFLRFKKSDTPTTFPAQLAFSVKTGAREHLQRMMDRAELRSPVALIRQALTMYSLLTDHAAQGGKVFLRYPDGTETVFDPTSCKESEDFD